MCTIITRSDPQTQVKHQLICLINGRVKEKISKDVKASLSIILQRQQHNLSHLLHNKHTRQTNLFLMCVWTEHTRKHTHDVLTETSRG